ncbi:MAG: YeeE/YedE thiosulfate transporter family protein [Methylococcales bacterium]|nr:YeeE/YedE thiosulfate transporter family protein [Methylococcales bacterium]
MENFTPYASLVGGLFIGLSATIMLLLNGRITGISGMVSGLISPDKGESLWRLAFIFGMMIGASAFVFFFPESFSARENFSPLLLIIGGFLVGFGTRLGNGCTSGHGVCGIARFSIRSLVATVVFIFSGGLSVFVIRHVIGLSS